MSKIYAVIMAGGAGTRFWPASRSLRPKQLLPLAGAENETLLAATIRRLRPLVTEDRVVVVTGAHLADATARAVPAVSTTQILREPAPRNTAPCIAWANATIARLDPDAVVMVLPSDHFIADEPKFQQVLAAAVASAERGRVTTVGVVPTRPETGYGYIELGGDLGGNLDDNLGSDRGGGLGSGGTLGDRGGGLGSSHLGDGAGVARAVKRFVEKPDRARAEAFVAAGPSSYLWNAGMFFFRVRDMAALLARHLPAVASGVARMMDGDDALVHEIFPTLESISIDHGVMEKAEGLAVVPGDFGWSDVGSWQSAWELADRDSNGNALGPRDLVIDGKDNLVRALGTTPKSVTLVGVNDLVVVETDDAILVIPRERAQDVRLVVDALKRAGKTALL